MASATYSRNPVVNGVINIASSATSGSLYTAPATGYAIVSVNVWNTTPQNPGSSVTRFSVGSSINSGQQLYFSEQNSGTISIGSNANVIDAVGPNANVPTGVTANTASGTFLNVYVGPGMSIFVNVTTSGTQVGTLRYFINGVEFKNG